MAFRLKSIRLLF